METVHNPHDKLFHEIYSRKEEAQSFLEHYLPQAVIQHIEPGSLEICKDSFVDEELKAYFSDMLYEVNLRGKPCYIYVLFEHKSYEDRLIHMQLLEYMLKIWRLHLKQQRLRDSHQRQSVQLPIILPLVIYHGEHAWPYGVRFSELLTGPTELLSKYIPDFAIILTDLTCYSDHDIKGTVLSRVVLLLFKHIFDPDPRQELPHILGLMGELVNLERGLQYIETLLRYVCSATDRLTTEELLTMVQQALDKQGGDIVMTIAEQLRTEGMEKGRQEGLEEGFERGRQEGQQEGRQEGKFIGEILLIQRMLALRIYDEEELERKSLDELRSILASMEAKLRKSQKTTM